MHNLNIHKLVYLNKILHKDGAQGGSPNLCCLTEVLHKHKSLVSHMSDMSCMYVVGAVKYWCILHTTMIVDSPS